MSILGNNIKKVIGIIGGMGPKAGLTLHNKLIDKFLKFLSLSSEISSGFASSVISGSEMIL